MSRIVPSPAERVTASQVFVVHSGEYSGWSVHAILRAAVDIDLDAEYLAWKRAGGDDEGRYCEVCHRPEAEHPLLPGVWDGLAGQWRVAPEGQIRGVEPKHFCGDGVDAVQVLPEYGDEHFAGTLIRKGLAVPVDEVWFDGEEKHGRYVEDGDDSA